MQSSRGHADNSNISKDDGPLDLIAGLKARAVFKF
jgi:hypothetical protein